MQRAYPESTNPDDLQAAAEGTAAHWAMAELIEGRLPMEGDRAPNGVVLNEEMIEGADMIAEDVRTTLEAAGLPMSAAIVEKPVTIKRIHPLCWGTPDVRAWLRPNKLVTWDFKFGHRYVPEFENLQGVGYTAGAIEESGKLDLTVDCEFRIVQPRSYGPGGPVRTWKFNGADIRGEVNRINAAVRDALESPAPATRPGPACRDCRAARACEALQRASQSVMDYVGIAFPHDLSPQALGIELRYIERAFDLLKARKEALEEQGAALARTGIRIPHFTMQNGSGRTYWTKSAAEIIAMGELMNVKLAKAPEAITPAAAAKAGFSPELIAKFSQRTPGAAKLVLDDGSQARRIFSK